MATLPIVLLPALRLGVFFQSDAAPSTLKAAAPAFPAKLWTCCVANFKVFFWMK
jgi:hypothetical protein